MEELVQWLAAQLDTDTEKATAALWAGDERWRAFHREIDDKWIVEDTHDEGVAQMLEQAANGEGLARHIVAWEPLRVLREINAKRQLLYQFEHRGNSVRAVVKPPVGGVWDDLLRLLALPYEDRPGFREEWRP